MISPDTHIFHQHRRNNLTIVCYKDGVMAADTRIVHGDAGIIRGSKLMKKRVGRHDHILGFAGDVSYAKLYCDWYCSKKQQPMPDQLRHIPEDRSFTVLILIGKRLYEADGICRPMEIEAKFHAIGSGAQAALGAMHAGSSALQAAKIACKIDPNCGLPVQTMFQPVILPGVSV